MRRFLAALAVLLVPVAASAQSGPSGTFTPGHALMSLVPSGAVYGDAGSSAGSIFPPGTQGGNLSTLGITGTGLPLCVNDAVISGAYHQLCFGALALGGGLISYNAYGGASALGLQININGTNYAFPGAGNGNVVGPTSPSPTSGDLVTWNGGTTVKDGGPAAPTYPTDAALKAAPADVAPLVYRIGFTAAGDTDPLAYKWSGTACSLNAGAGDNGSQVAPGTGTGCWLAVFPASGINPKQFGVVGDGTTDDTTAWQATINYAESVSGKIQVPTGLLSHITSGLTASTGSVTIEGPGVGPNTGDQCLGASGFTTRSNINLLTLHGSGSQVNGLCFSMGVSGTPATAGAAITLGSNGSPGTVNLTAIKDWIYYSYIGIDIGGVSSSGIAGTNTVLVRDNIIDYPAHIGISVGRLSSFGTTIGVSLVNNLISCSGTLADYAVAFYDGYIADFHGNEPSGCKVGTGIIPGTANAEAQVASGNFSDILGDSSTVNQLLIEPTTAQGQVVYLDFTRWFAGMIATGTSSAVLIENPNGGYVQSLSFVGGVVHGANNGAINLIDLEDNVGDITFSGNQIVADGGGTANVGVYDNSIGQNISYIGNNFNGLGGRGNLNVGIEITSGAGDLRIITDNNLSELTTTPISFGPSSPGSYRATITNNIPYSIELPSIASAATIAAPMNERIGITGSTTISAMTGFWVGRTVTLFPLGGASLTLATGGGTGAFCDAFTGAANVPATATWLIGSPGCWAVK